MYGDNNSCNFGTFVVVLQGNHSSKPGDCPDFRFNENGTVPFGRPINRDFPFALSFEPIQACLNMHLTEAPPPPATSGHADFRCPAPIFVRSVR
jgi:hypothetical protein